MAFNTSEDFFFVLFDCFDLLRMIEMFVCKVPMRHSIFQNDLVTFVFDVLQRTLRTDAVARSFSGCAVDQETHTQIQAGARRARL